MSDIKEGDVFIATRSGDRYTIILVKGDWVWANMEAKVLAGCDPMPQTMKRQHFLDTKWFRKEPEFKVGDTVEYHTPHTNVTTSGKGRVLAIHEDRAWVHFPNHTVPLSPLCTSLRKAA